MLKHSTIKSFISILNVMIITTTNITIFKNKTTLAQTNNSNYKVYIWIDYIPVFEDTSLIGKVKNMIAISNKTNKNTARDYQCYIIAASAGNFKDLNNKTRFYLFSTNLINDLYVTSRYDFLTKELKLEPINLNTEEYNYVTQRHCHQADLRLKVKDIEKAWKQFVSKDFPGIGYLKTLEVTRAYDCFYANEYIGRFGSTLIKQWQSSLKFHNCWIPHLWKQYSSEMVNPHIHCVLLVKPNYFNESYIDHLGWVINWRLASRLCYNPSVRIKLVKQQKLNDAIFETTKYCFKPFDLGTDKLGSFLPRQLHGLRLLSLGGIFKDYFNQEQLDSIDSNLVSGTEFKQSGIMEVIYDWSNEYSEYSISKIG